MSYRQDGVPRTCSICSKLIEEFQSMLDLFRQVQGATVEWVHETCAQKAIEIFLSKRRQQK